MASRTGRGDPRVEHFRRGTSPAVGTRLDCRAVLSPEQRELQEVTEVTGQMAQASHAAVESTSACPPWGQRRMLGHPGKGTATIWAWDDGDQPQVEEGAAGYWSGS